MRVFFAPMMKVRRSKALKEICISVRLILSFSVLFFFLADCQWTRLTFWEDDK